METFPAMLEITGGSPRGQIDKKRNTIALFSTLSFSMCRSKGRKEETCLRLYFR